MNKLKIISPYKTIEITNGRPFHFYTKNGVKLDIKEFQEFKGLTSKFCQPHLLYFIGSGDLKYVSNFMDIYYGERILVEEIQFMEPFENNILEDLADQATAIVWSHIQQYIDKLNSSLEIKNNKKKLEFINQFTKDYNVDYSQCPNELDIFYTLNTAYVLGVINQSKLRNKLTLPMKSAISVILWDKIFYSLLNDDRAYLFHCFSDFRYLESISKLPDNILLNYISLSSSTISKGKSRKNKVNTINDFKGKYSELILDFYEKNAGLEIAKLKKLIKKSSELSLLTGDYETPDESISEGVITSHIREVFKRIDELAIAWTGQLQVNSKLTLDKFIQHIDDHQPALKDRLKKTHIQLNDKTISKIIKIS